MVAVAGAAHVRFKGAEVAEEIGTAEFVVEGGAAERAFGHDGERGRNAAGRAVSFGGSFARRAVRIVFPLLRRFRKMNRGGREAREARLRTSAAAGRALVADFAARTGGSARERRNCGRVVVRFDLENGVNAFCFAAEGRAVGILFVGTRIEADHIAAFENGSIVGIGRNGSEGLRLMRIADHAEERFLALFSVNRPAGIEDLVAAVFGIGLREHHEFDVGRIALQAREGIGKVFDRPH